jgi:hypothetical protein
MFTAVQVDEFVIILSDKLNFQRLTLMFPTDRFLVFYLYVLHAGLYEYDIQQ